MRYFIVAAACAVALAGCHRNPGVIQTGPDTYMAGATSGSGFKSDLAVTERAMHNASAFCAKQGKVAQMTDHTNSGHQALTMQNSQVSFRCVSPAATAPSPASAASE